MNSAQRLLCEIPAERGYRHEYPGEPLGQAERHNPFRLLLSSLAYVLLEAIRRLGVKGTELARAEVTTIRLKLLKIRAVIDRNTRRVRFMLSSAHPCQHPFWLVAARLKPE